MVGDEYVLLDTGAFDNALGQKDSLIKRYNELNERYDMIVAELAVNWKGRGAEAFLKDAHTVKSNIVGIYDILKIMCDTLTDCKEIFAECDRALGEFNRNPDAEQ
jgi:uncharacterized protein YukE